jgi:hypothetical protein
MKCQEVGRNEWAQVEVLPHFPFALPQERDDMSVLVRAQGRDLVFPHTAGKSLSSIVSESISKLGGSLEPLGPDQVFVLRYNGKTLENSDTLGRARVPLGAQLTLVKQKRHTGSKETKVALQLPGQSKRLTADLDMSTSLLHVLAHFEGQIGANILAAPAEPFSFPILTFMNRQFSTPSDLVSNTLGSLGANNGLFRLTFGVPTGESPLVLGLTSNSSKALESGSEDEPEMKKAKPNNVDVPEELSDTIVLPSQSEDSPGSSKLSETVVLPHIASQSLPVSSDTVVLPSGPDLPLSDEISKGTEHRITKSSEVLPKSTPPKPCTNPVGPSHIPERQVQFFSRDRLVSAPTKKGSKHDSGKTTFPSEGHSNKSKGQTVT